MTDQQRDKRKYKRYNTEVKIYFDFAYDLETKVEFEVIKEDGTQKSHKKYLAVSKNISAEGLSFISYKSLREADLLYLELFLPSAKVPIHMKGEVKWCSPIEISPSSVSGKQEKQKYNVGIKLTHVDGQLVQESVHFDKEYEVNWSVVLESVFGSYKLLMGGKFKKQ